MTRAQGVWQHPNFVKFWSGQTISLMGSQVTALALPLIASTTLNATPLQMGILAACGSAPYWASIMAGVWVDRLPRKPILVLTDIGQAISLIIVVAGGLAGWLKIEWLYIVMLVNGGLTMVSGIARQALVPRLIPRELFTEGNSRMALSESAAEIAGPGFAGGLVQLLSAPVALIIDAVSFFISAFAISQIKINEPGPDVKPEERNFWREARTGLQVLVSNPLIRPLAVSNFILNFFGGIHDALFLLYVTRELGLAPIYFGLYFAVGSASGIMAGLVVQRVTGRIGIGPAIALGAFVIGAGWLAFPLASLWPGWALAFFAAKALVGGFGNTLFNVIETSLSQALVPEHQLGRYSATMGFFALAFLPLGALMGGAIATAFGLLPALLIGLAGSLTASLAVRFSPLWILQQVPVAD
jgi:Major Facilitator Superfamily